MHCRSSRSLQWWWKGVGILETGSNSFMFWISLFYLDHALAWTELGMAGLEKKGRQAEVRRVPETCCRVNNKVDLREQTLQYLERVPKGHTAKWEQISFHVCGYGESCTKEQKGVIYEILDIPRVLGNFKSEYWLGSSVWSWKLGKHKIIKNCRCHAE